MQSFAVTRLIFLSILAGVVLLLVPSVCGSQNSRLSGGANAPQSDWTELKEDERELLEKYVPDPHQEEKDAVKKAVIKRGKKTWRRLEQSRKLGKAARKIGKVVTKYGLRWAPPVRAGLAIEDSFATGLKIGGVIFRRIGEPLIDRHFEKKGRQLEVTSRREIAEIRKRGRLRRKLERDLARLSRERRELDRELAELEDGGQPITGIPVERAAVRSESQRGEAERPEQDGENPKTDQERIARKTADREREREYQERLAEVERQDEASREEDFAEPPQAQEAPPDGVQCAATPACESLSQRAESVINHINAKHRYADAGVTNSALFLALVTRVGIGCTKQCAKAEPTAFCRSHLGRIASELGNSYQSAVNMAYSAAAERSYVADFESYPSTSQFARSFGLQVFGGGNVDTCGE